MKILFFSYAYPNPCQPGLATFNRTMIAGLAKHHEVRVVSPVPFTDNWKSWAMGRLPRGLNDHAFQAVPNVPAEYCAWYYTPKLFRSQYGRFMKCSVGSSLNRVMREFQPDVVLSYWTHPDGEVAVKTAHEFGVRAATMVGGSDVLLNGRRGSRRTAILNVLQAADGVISVSESIRQVLIEDGIPVNKLYVAPRGIDRDLFHEGNRDVARKNLGLPDQIPILISVGRLVDVKGHVHLIEACQLLARRGIQFRCYILGDGPLQTSLNQQIERHELSNSVKLKGSQTPAQLADWYRAADLSVLASLSEGIPNVLLESIACGTPFVASNVGGIPEIADPVLDCLVPQANPTALAGGLAAQLSRSQETANNPRCFEPPSMTESAKILSSILQSIKQTRIRPTTPDTKLHGTMTDMDSTYDLTNVNAPKVYNCNAQANETGIRHR